MELLYSPTFWIGLLEIIWINIILSGDNAVVIALSARSLPRRQQTRAIVLGSAGAVVLRVALTVVAAELMELSFLQIAGGLLLLWIAIHLFGNEEPGDADEAPPPSFAVAVRTILLADLVMSLDNVIAVAAAAQGDLVLLGLGLALSIPLVVFGSTIMIRVMERYPVVVVLGAGLIGWVGGETILNDALLRGVVDAYPWLPFAGGAICAVLVVLIGRHLQAHSGQSSTA